MDIYSYDNYREFLLDWINAQPHKGHGIKAKLARAADCQTAYISQMTLGRAHLSLEQAEKIAQYIGLSPDEVEFFLLIVQHERAGSENLKKIFKKNILRTRDLRSQLKNRAHAQIEFSTEAQTTYYSSWTYLAVHILLTIPEFQNQDAIARKLNLPVRAVGEILNFLLKNGLAQKIGEQYKSLKSRFHLPHDSPLISKHHANWRIKSLQALECRQDENLHYSSVISISANDAVIIRERILKSIEENKKIIKDSAEEKLYCYSLDYFEL